MFVTACFWGTVLRGAGITNAFGGKHILVNLVEVSKDRLAYLCFLMGLVQREPKGPTFSTSRLLGFPSFLLTSKHMFVFLFASQSDPSIGAPSQHRKRRRQKTNRWKICERFDDTAPVIAYAPVDTLGHLPPAGWERQKVHPQTEH